MTDKLHCPFCSGELESVELQSGKINMGCTQCRIWGIDKIWKLAIDGKKAQDALKIAIRWLKKISETRCPDCCDVDAESALNEIASITKQEE